MISFKHVSFFMSAFSLALLSSQPVWSAAGSVNLTLNGKPVTTVPVDQLPQVQVTVNTGGQPFKTVYAGQWGSLNHSMQIVTSSFAKGGTPPDPSDSEKWKKSSIAESFEDTGWFSKNSISQSLAPIAKSSSYYGYTTNDELVLAARYMKQAYTGKTVWQDGGWVKETQWYMVGPALGKAVLKLAPPTFAGSANWDQLIQQAIGSSTEKAEMMSQTLLSPTTYGGQQVAFKGTKIQSLKVNGAPVYNWNYDNAGDIIYAKVPVTLVLNAVKTTTLEDLPIPNKLEGTFTCENVILSVNYPMGSKKWQVDQLEVSSGFRSQCKTAEGKTADDLLKAANPLGALDGTKPVADQARDLLNQFGL